MMMLYRLVRLIETNSQALAACLLSRVQNLKATSDYKNVPSDDLNGYVSDVYGHLGNWLITKDEFALESRYLEVGARRASQGVHLSQLMWVIALTKENLWEFIRKESVLERPVEVFGQVEMLQLLDEFFDRAIYYAAVGHERWTKEHLLSEPTLAIASSQ